MSVTEEESQLALEYWSKIPPTLDGVLGGFGFISQRDIEASQLFLDILKSQFKLECDRALDCGAGIGRVTKHLLSENFEKVDLVESDHKFMTAVDHFMGDKLPKVGCKYNCRLQDFIPEHKYNVIWNQWVLGHLNDEDLISFLKRCKSALSENGIIVIKENVTSSGHLEKDEIDQSNTRPLKHFMQIFSKSKLKRIKQCRQTNLPDGIYPVYMFALAPDDHPIQPTDDHLIQPNDHPIQPNDDHPIQPTDDHPIQPTDDHPIQPTDDHPIQPTDDHPIQPTDDHPIQPTDDHPIQPTDDHPIQPTDDHPIQPNDDHPIQPNDDHPIQPNDDHPIQSNDNHLIQPNDNQPIQPNDND